MKIDIYFVVKIIRFVYNLPLIILISLGNYYTKLLKFIDPKNHNNVWQELLEKNIYNFKSKKIFVSNNPLNNIQFYTPTSIAGYRAKTFLTKEPETLEWIDNFGGKKIFFDIGANMGIYSIYYAKKMMGQVYSFEPSFKNLEILSKNIKLNKLEKNIKIISNPLSEKSNFSNFAQNNFIYGEAKASLLVDRQIKKTYFKKFQNKNNEIQYETVSFSLDRLIDLKILKNPDLIKIDVDGNEMHILKGAKKTIKKKKKMSILVEIRKDTESQIIKFMTKLGFTLIKKAKDNLIWHK